MDTNSIPIIVTQNNNSGARQHTDQSRALTGEIEAHMGASATAFEQLASSVITDNERAYQSALQSSDKTIGRVFVEANKSLTKSSKLADKLQQSLEDDALGHIDGARNAIRLAGGNPTVLLDDVFTQNINASHSESALETLVIPMLDAQMKLLPVNQVCDADDPDPRLCFPDGTPRNGPGGRRPPDDDPPHPGRNPRFPVPRDPRLPGNPRPIPGDGPDDCMGKPEECRLENIPVPPAPPKPPAPPCPAPVVQCPAPVVNCPDVYVTVNTGGTINQTPPFPTPFPVPIPIPIPAPGPFPGPPTPPIPRTPPTVPPAPVPPVPPTPSPAPTPAPHPPEPTKPKPVLVDLPEVPSTSWDAGDPCYTAFIFEKQFGVVAETGQTKSTIESWFNAVGDIFNYYGSNPNGEINVVSTAIDTVRDFGTGLFEQLLDGLTGYSDVDRAVILQTGGLLTLSGWCETLTRSPMTRLTQDMLYGFQSQTAFELPTQADFDAIYLTGQITKEQWVCYTKALGHAPHTHAMSLETKVNRPGITDIVSLRMRGLLSQQEYFNAQRRNGVVTERDANAYIKLAEYVPGPSDIVRMMTRDVMNPTVVDQGRFDDGFKENYTGILESWGESQGVTRDVMLADWRAHWTMPSNTDIYEFIRRLRPGRVSAGLEFTKDDATELLKVNDHAPGYIDRLVEISYHPINRTDVEAAFISGAMPLAEVYERYLDLGYSPRDAKQLQDASVIKKRNQTQQSAGIWTKRKINREYIGGGLSRHDAEQLLSIVIPDEAQLKELLDSADLLRETQAKNACVKGAKRQYFTGKYSSQEVKAVLLDLGLDLVQLDALIKGWICERENRAKEPTVKLLGQWAEYGIITVDEMLTRLVNLGYSIEDGKRIIIALNIELNIKALAKAKAEAKEQAAERRRNEADARRREKERKAKEKEDNPKPKK